MPARRRPTRRYPSCDYHDHGERNVVTHRLNTSGRSDAYGSSGVQLCRPAWAAEMTWRRARNRLGSFRGAARFPIRKWPG